MAANDITRGDPQDAAPHVRHQQLVLLEILDPPAYGKTPAELASRLGFSTEEIEHATVALEDKGLAIITTNYVAASGPAIDMDELWPVAL